MKIPAFFKRALISFIGLVIVLNCTSQPAKEKRAERNRLRKSEHAKNIESLDSMIHSRNFVFKSGTSESKQVSSLSEKHEYDKSVIRINGSLVRISGLNRSQWWKTTSGRIDTWELTENPEDLTYSISFIAHTGNSDTAVLIKIFSDKTAIAQFGGSEFRGQVTPN